MEDEKSEGLKKLVKVKVAEDRKAEICSVRKEERRREVFAGWRREELIWRPEDVGLCKEARWEEAGS